MGSSRAELNDNIADNWELPHVDAVVYIRDVIETCTSHSEFRDDDYDFQEELENAVERVLEDPEMLFQNHPDLEPLAESEPDAFESAVYDLVIAELIADDRDIENWDEYEGHWNEEPSYLEPDDVSAQYRELIQIAHDALAHGDAEELVAAVESLIELTNYDPDPDGELESWAGVLARTADSFVANELDQDEADQIESLVITAIRALSVRLCELIAVDPKTLLQIEWRQLECIIAEALDGLGFHVALTPPSKDGGKDVIAECTVSGRRQTYYIEIKHWRSGKRVDTRQLFDFVEVNVLDRTHGGLYLSTSGYTPRVFSHLAELTRQGVFIGGEYKIVSLCQQFVRMREGLWMPQQPLPRILFENTSQMSQAARMEHCY